MFLYALSKSEARLVATGVWGGVWHPQETILVGKFATLIGKSMKFP